MKPPQTGTKSANQPILVVEDNEVDYMAIERGFRRSRLANPLVHATTGDQALAYLHRSAPYDAEQYLGRPGIILLDLNLPGMLGTELLALIKADESLRSIPVIVLTTADADSIVKQCYKLGANSYIRKPVDVGGFLDSLQLMTDYWFSVAIIPQTGEGGHDNN